MTPNQTTFGEYEQNTNNPTNPGGSDELQADGGQVATTTDDEPKVGEPDADDLPGDYDPDAGTVGDGWEGERIYTSWGYGQTNVELAKIVDVSGSGKTVLARMVVPEQVGHGKQSHHLKPSGDEYGDEFRLHVREGMKDAPTFRGSYPYLKGGEMDDGTRLESFLWWDPEREHISETASQYGH